MEKLQLDLLLGSWNFETNHFFNVFLFLVRTGCVSQLWICHLMQRGFVVQNMFVLILARCIFVRHHNLFFIRNESFAWLRYFFCWMFFLFWDLCN